MLLGLSRRLLLKRWTFVFGAAGSKSKYERLCRAKGWRFEEVECGGIGVLEYWGVGELEEGKELDVLIALGRVSKAYTIPLPPAKNKSGWRFTSASEGGHQVLWKILGAMPS